MAKVKYTARAPEKAPEPQEEEKKKRRRNPRASAQGKVIEMELKRGSSFYIVPRALFRDSVRQIDPPRLVFPVLEHMTEGLGEYKRVMPKPKTTQWSKKGIHKLQRATENTFVHLVRAANDLRRCARTGSKEPPRTLRARHLIMALHADKKNAWVLQGVFDHDKKLGRTFQERLLSE